MAPILFALFVVVPIIEIALFIQVGEAIGVWQTIALVILTAVAGTALLRAQGLATLRRAQTSMNQGQVPVREVFDGACLLVAGVLLLTPGFMTDAFGLSLFLPPVRSAILGVAAKAVRSGRIHVSGMNSGAGGPRAPGEEFHGGGFHPHGPGGFGPGGFGPGGRPGGPADLEGEYREVNPDADAEKPAGSDESDPDRRLDRK